MSRIVRPHGFACAAIIALLAAIAVAQTRPERQQLEGNQATETALVRFPRAVSSAEQEQEKVLVPCHVEFASAQACEEGCAKLAAQNIGVFDRFDEFADLLLEYDWAKYERNKKLRLKELGNADPTQLAILTKLPGYVWHEEHGVTFVPPPPRPQRAEAGARAVREPTIRGGVGNFTGKGVIIAILDTGIDFRHPDFTTDGGQSRLLYYWDTLDASGPQIPGKTTLISYPNGAPVGALYDNAALNELLKPERALDPPFDLGGHGTGCAGVAAGNGRFSKRRQSYDPLIAEQDYRGVAHEADLIAVRIGERDSMGQSWMLGTIIGWLDRFANKENKPLVISCSYGGHFSGHDARLILERQVGKRLPPDRPGRAICIAAGNEGYDRMHMSATISKDSSTQVRWFNRFVGKTFSGSVRIYVQDAEPDQLNLKPLAESEQMVRRKQKNPISKAVEIDIASIGNATMRLETTSKTPQFVDVYVHGDGQLAGYSNSTLIGTPASMVGAIAVGSYDFNGRMLTPLGWDSMTAVTDDRPIIAGTISKYSNAGYLRRYDPDGRAIVKPDLVAPGQWHVAPASRFGDFGSLVRSFMYQSFNGTSAATPYTAGVIALLMQKNPTLSANDFRNLVKQFASDDEQTGKRGEGKLPNPTWGYGKLDQKAVEHLIREVQPPSGNR